MKDRLREHLTPRDDGRAFVDAVLLRASGALYRRLRQAGASPAPAWGWLARWARPWVVALLILAAGLALYPTYRPASRVELSPETEARAEALVVAAQPEDVFALVEGR